MIHPSKDEHFALIDREDILKWQKFNIPTQVHCHPLIFLQKLHACCTKDPNLLINETSRGTVMLIDHSWHILILIRQRIVLLAQVGQYLPLCCISSKQVNPLLILYQGAFASEVQRTCDFFQPAVGLDHQRWRGRHKYFSLRIIIAGIQQKDVILKRDWRGKIRQFNRAFLKSNHVDLAILTVVDYLLILRDV